MKIYDVCNDLSLSINNEESKDPCKWIKKEIFFRGENTKVELGYSVRYKELIYLRSETVLCLIGEKVK
jgi:hypothetical protein